MILTHDSYDKWEHKKVRCKKKSSIWFGFEGVVCCRGTYANQVQVMSRDCLRSFWMCDLEIIDEPIKTKIQPLPLPG